MNQKNTIFYYIPFWIIVLLYITRYNISGYVLSFNESLEVEEAVCKDVVDDLKSRKVSGFRQYLVQLALRKMQKQLDDTATVKSILGSLNGIFANISFEKFKE